MTETMNDHEVYQTNEVAPALTAYKRDNGSRRYSSSRRCGRVYLATHRNSPQQKSELVLVDPNYEWTRKNKSEKLHLLTGEPAGVRRRALLALKYEGTNGTGKARNTFREIQLQSKNLLARELMTVFGKSNVNLNNNKQSFVHLTAPIIVTHFDESVFINFVIKNPGRGTTTKRDARRLFDPNNRFHSQVEVLIHEDGRTVEVTWNLSKSFTESSPDFVDIIGHTVKDTLQNPLTECIKHFRDSTLGVKSDVKAEDIAKVEDVDPNQEVIEMEENQEEPQVEPKPTQKAEAPDGFVIISQDDLDRLLAEKVDAALSERKASATGGKSKDEYVAERNRAKENLWKSTELYRQYKDTPLGEIASRTSIVSFDDPARRGRTREVNHDRGILAHPEHWHTLAIRALHDEDFKDGEVIDIDEVLFYLESRLREDDRDQKEVKVGDNYATRFLSVLSFFVDNASDLGLRVIYDVARTRGTKSTDHQTPQIHVRVCMEDARKVFHLTARVNPKK